MKRFVRGLVPVVILTWSGCAKYHAQPIVPAQVESNFEARTLSDPGLRSYVDANLPVKPAAWPPRILDLSTLTLVAFYYHPDLEVARARVGLAAAGVRTAAGRPNPVIGMGPGYEDLPESPFLFRFSFDLPIETAGKRGYRIAQAQRLTDAARLALAETAWQVRSRLRAALLDYLLSGRELSLRSAEETSQSERVSLMRKRLVVGQVSQPSVDLVRFERADAVLAIRSTESRLARGRVVLAGALGLPVSALDGFTFAWPGLDSPPREDALSPATLQRAGLLNRLDVRRSLAEYAAAEAALQLEIARQYPNLHFGPGYSFDDAANKFTFVPSITLPVFNRNQGPIAQAEARRKEAASCFLALQARVISDTEKALAGYRAALEELSEAEQTVAIQQSRENATRVALHAGELDRLTLLSTRLQALVAEDFRLQALRRAQDSLGELEDAVQRPLTPEPALPELPASSARPNHEHQK
jgi:cobalt-zinc-cadmium efflux system outer membrane protein